MQVRRPIAVVGIVSNPTYEAALLYCLTDPKLVERLFAQMPVERPQGYAVIGIMAQDDNWAEVVTVAIIGERLYLAV